MFDKKSRYRDLEAYQVVDRRGRTVAVVPAPPAPDQALLGVYRMRQGQRLDHLAHQFLADPACFWRICEIIGVMLAEALSELAEIAIPS